LSCPDGLKQKVLLDLEDIQKPNRSSFYKALHSNVKTGLIGVRIPELNYILNPDKCPAPQCSRKSTGLFYMSLCVDVSGMSSPEAPSLISPSSGEVLFCQVKALELDVWFCGSSNMNLQKEIV
jgi:hypothetical protein